MSFDESEFVFNSKKALRTVPKVGYSCGTTFHYRGYTSLTRLDRSAAKIRGSNDL